MLDMYKHVNNWVEVKKDNYNTNSARNEMQQARSKKFTTTQNNCTCNRGSKGEKL